LTAIVRLSTPAEVIDPMTRFRFLAAVSLVVVLLPVAASQEKKLRSLGTIERLDPAFDKLIPKDALCEVLADGFSWAEGPVWVPRDGGYLVFSDVIENTLWKWQEGKGKSVFLKPSGYSGKNDKLREPGANGNTLDPQGRLVSCEHGNRRVARLEKDGKKTTLADRFKGKRFNSPNDLAYKSNGDLYFTDPPYGLMVKDAKGFPGMEMDYCGVYRLSRASRTITLLTREMSKPNGIAFSPDEKTLYVANSDPEKAVWMAFPVKGDGTLGKGRVFFDATKWVETKKGLPDGLRVDKQGNLFATGPGGVLVFAPDCTHLGTIATGVPTANCAFGGDDYSVLYVTADKQLCRVRTTTRGK
jgi:gluconolactonase